MAVSANEVDPGLVDGDRVRRARELRRLTQAELAERAGVFTASALSQIERNRTKPSRATLAAICDATRMPATYFTSPAAVAEPPGFFRGLRSMPASTRKVHLARASALRDLVHAIEQLVRLPELSVPRLDLRDFGSLDQVAEHIRSIWEIPPGPIDSMVRTLERQGCVVVRQDAFEDAVDAYSLRYPDYCLVVLGRTKGVTTRSRFDAAHELAHLVLHQEEDAGTSAAEKQAQSFASAFLMPRRDIEHELPATVDFEHLLELKMRWRVSMQALLYRSKTLGVMAADEYTRAMKYVSARGWRRREPGDREIGALEEPSLLGRAAALIESMEISLADLAERAALPLDVVQELVESGGDSRPVLEA